MLNLWFSLMNELVIIIGMSIYDERMVSNSNQLYFQLIPLLIFKKQQTQCPQLPSLTFKLYKGQLLCDKSKQPVQLSTQDGVYMRILKSFLNFNISINDLTQLSTCTLKVYSTYKSMMFDSIQDVKQNINNEHETKIQSKSIQQFGMCSIDISRFVNQFAQKGTRNFKQQIQINQQFILIFDLFVEKTRFALEKYVRSIREKQKYYIKRESDDWLESSVSNKSNATVQLRKSLQIIQLPKIHKSNSKNVELVPKKSKDKNYLIIAEQQSADSKSFNKEQLCQNNQTVNRKISRNSELDDDPLRHVQQDYAQYISESKKQQTKQIKNLSSSDRNKNQRIQVQKKRTHIQKLESKNKNNVFKKTFSLGDDEEQKTEKKVAKNNPGSITTTKAFIVAFIIFSFFALIQVMTPSRRV